WIDPFRIVNNYGLFAVMTTERNEIDLAGSFDGTTWSSYRFDYKPGPLDARPRFSLLHMPRLDWQMWFASLGRVRTTSGSSFFSSASSRVRPRCERSSPRLHSPGLLPSF